MFTMRQEAASSVFAKICRVQHQQGLKKPLVGYLYGVFIVDHQCIVLLANTEARILWKEMNPDSLLIFSL